MRLALLAIALLFWATVGLAEDDLRITFNDADVLSVFGNEPCEEGFERLKIQLQKTPLLHYEWIEVECGKLTVQPADEDPAWVVLDVNFDYLIEQVQDSQDRISALELRVEELERVQAYHEKVYHFTCEAPDCVVIDTMVPDIQTPDNQLLPARDPQPKYWGPGPCEGMCAGQARWNGVECVCPP